MRKRDPPGREHLTHLPPAGPSDESTVDGQTGCTQSGVAVADFTVASTPGCSTGPAGSGRTGTRCSCAARCGGNPPRTSPKLSPRAAGSSSPAGCGNVLRHPRGREAHRHRGRRRRHRAVPPLRDGQGHPRREDHHRARHDRRRCARRRPVDRRRRGRPRHRPPTAAGTRRARWVRHTTAPVLTRPAPGPVVGPCPCRVPVTGWRPAGAARRAAGSRW
jgi:hypothetical protein